MTVRLASTATACSPDPAHHVVVRVLRGVVVAAGLRERSIMDLFDSSFPGVPHCILSGLSLTADEPHGASPLRNGTLYS